MADGRHSRLRAIALALGAAAALTLAACGSPAKALHHGKSNSATTSSTEAGAGPASAAGGSTTSAPGSATTKAGASSSPGGQGTPQPAGNAGPTPATPGTYTYDQSGSTTIGGSSQPVPAQGTEVIDAPTSTGSGTWTQVWHAYLDPHQPPSDTTFAFSPTAVAVASEVMRASYGGQTASFSCTFSPPVPVIGWPLRVGYSFSGSGDCGSFTVSLSGQITGTHTVTLDGSPITTYVVEATYTTKGQVNSTTTETDWFDPGSRLDVHMASDTKGSYGAFPFEVQSTRDLVSEHPS